MSQYFEESMLIEQPDETPEQLLARYEQQARAWRHRQGVETDERAATFAGDVAHMIEQLTGTLSTALSQTHEGRQAPNSGVGGILVRELDEWAEKTANLRSLLHRSADHIEFVETDAHYRSTLTRELIAETLWDSVQISAGHQHPTTWAEAKLTMPSTARSFYAEADAVLALLSQPTPTGEPEFPVMHDEQGRARFGCSLVPSAPAEPTCEQIADRLRGDIFDAVPDDNDMQHVLSLAADLLSQPNPTAELAAGSEGLREDASRDGDRSLRPGEHLGTEHQPSSPIRQPTPTAEPCGRRAWPHEEYQDEDDACVCLLAADHEGLHQCGAGCGVEFAGGQPAEPPRTEDMARDDHKEAS